MADRKVWVVNTSSYALAIESGRHLFPGEVANLVQDDYIKQHLLAGRLAVADVRRKEFPSQSRQEPQEKVEDNTNGN